MFHNRRKEEEERRRSSVATASHRRSTEADEEEHRRSGVNGDNQEEEEEAKPVGEIESIQKLPGTEERDVHYTAFEYGGNCFRLGDHVLISADEDYDSPLVASIKEIYQCSTKRELMITAQWFYRPKEVKMKGGGTWERCDSRELLYSFHYDHIPASSVMHPCDVYFIPPWKQLPVRKEDPGFIVKNVYDFIEGAVYKLTDKDYYDDKQREIDRLLKETEARLGDLPDLDEEFITPSDDEERRRRKRKRRSSQVRPSHESDRELIPPSNEEERRSRRKKGGSSQVGPSCQNASRAQEDPEPSVYRTILIDFQALTSVEHRNRWLEKLLMSLEHACSADDMQENDQPDRVQEEGTEGENQIIWPDSAVSAALALEKASEETFLKGHTKNNKLRELNNALKSDVVLARRLLRKEIDPLEMLKMSLADLKAGPRDESTKDQHEESQLKHVQMAKTVCGGCSKRNVMVARIYRERYQLECLDCGKVWFGSPDDATMGPC